jgi:hypothetical protein
MSSNYFKQFNSDGTLSYDRMPPGSIIQTLSTTKTDTATTTSTTWVDIAGLSITITPRFSNSRILITCNVNVLNTGQNNTPLRFVRNSTAIGIADTAGSRDRASFLPMRGETDFGTSSVGSMTFLDSPNTTSPTVYKLQWQTQGSTATLNRTGEDTDIATSGRPRTVSTITVQEIKQ